MCVRVCVCVLALSLEEWSCGPVSHVNLVHKDHFSMKEWFMDHILVEFWSPHGIMV